MRSAVFLLVVLVSGPALSLRADAAVSPPLAKTPTPANTPKPKQEDPKPVVSNFPAPPVYRPPTPPVVNAPLPPAPNKPPPPPPAPIHFTPARFTTHVPPPINPRFGRPRVAASVQSYLGNLDDARDLDVIVNNNLAQQRASHASAESYTQLYERQKKLYGVGALSKDELHQSRFDAESAEAMEKVYAALVKMYQARHDQRIYLMNCAANTVVFDLETFYAIYARDWEGQCESEAAMQQASEAQLRLNRALFDSTNQASHSGAASWTELEQRRRDLAAAEADTQAKADSASHCRQSIPTLQSLKVIFEPAPSER